MRGVETCERYAILSIIGPHAGEDEGAIFSRKIEDIKRCERTFWLVRSRKADPDTIQRFCREAKTQGEVASCLFIQPSVQGGAVPTKGTRTAQDYSIDGSRWEQFPAGMGPVTGTIDRGAVALVFDSLRTTSGTLDLWSYEDFLDRDRPLQIMRGASTFCVVGKQTGNPTGLIQSRYRGVVAVGRLTAPYCVYLR